MRSLYIVFLLVAPLFAVTEQSQKYLQMGESEYKQQRYKIAQQLFLNAYNSDNKNISALSNISLAYLKTNEFDKALFWGTELIQRRDTIKPVIRANTLYNMACAYEGLHQLGKAREYLQFAYLHNGKEVYKKEEQRIIKRIDSSLIANRDSLVNDKNSCLYNTILNDRYAKLRLYTSFDSSKGGDSVYNYIKSFKIKDSSLAPDFSKLPTTVHRISQNASLYTVDFNNDGIKDFYFFTEGGSGHYTDYIFLQKEKSGEVSYYNQLSGDGFAYYQPKIFIYEGVTYIIDNLYLNKDGEPVQKFDNHPDKQTKGKAHGPCLFRVDTTGLAFYSPFRQAYDYASIEVEEILNKDLFDQLVPKLDSSIFMKNDYGGESFEIDIDNDGYKETISTYASTAGGMMDKLWYRVILNDQPALIVDSTIFEGHTYSSEPALFKTKVKQVDGTYYLVNFYEEKSYKRLYQCRIFAFDERLFQIRSIVRFQLEKMKVRTSIH